MKVPGNVMQVAVDRGRRPWLAALRLSERLLQPCPNVGAQNKRGVARCHASKS
jgi:hypothetical protein